MTAERLQKKTRRREAKETETLYDERPAEERSDDHGHDQPQRFLRNRLYMIAAASTVSTFHLGPQKGGRDHRDDFGGGKASSWVDLGIENQAKPPSRSS